MLWHIWTQWKRCWLKSYVVVFSQINATVVWGSTNDGANDRKGNNIELTSREVIHQGCMRLAFRVLMQFCKRYEYFEQVIILSQEERSEARDLIACTISGREHKWRKKNNLWFNLFSFFLNGVVGMLRQLHLALPFIMVATFFYNWAFFVEIAPSLHHGTIRAICCILERVSCFQYYQVFRRVVRYIRAST